MEKPLENSDDDGIPANKRRRSARTQGKTKQTKFDTDETKQPPSESEENDDATELDVQPDIALVAPTAASTDPPIRNDVTGIETAGLSTVEATNTLEDDSSLKFPLFDKTATENKAVAVPDLFADKALKPVGNRELKQALLPVFSKPKVKLLVLRPANRPTGKAFTRAVTTLACRCGANIFKITFNGKPAYCFPMVQQVNNDANMAAVNWKIDTTKVQRDPKDHNKVLEFLGKKDSDGKQKRSLQNLFIRFPEGEDERTPEWRKKWGELAVSIYNSGPVQSACYGNNTLAYYAGDLSPRDETADRPYLSDFLTIKHTLEALQVAFSARSREDLLKDNSLLAHFFPQERFEEVRNFEQARENAHAYVTFENGPTFDG
jgi:hypothetical protein